MEATTAAATVDYRTHHGAPETNGLVDGAAYHDSVDYAAGQFTLRQVKENGGKITRVRLLTETIPGAGRFADVSYVHALLADGTTVNVHNGLNNLTPMRNLKGEMIAWAKREGVNAKALGLLDNGNWSTV